MDRKSISSVNKTNLKRCRFSCNKSI